MEKIFFIFITAILSIFISYTQVKGRNKLRRVSLECSKCKYIFEPSYKFVGGSVGFYHAFWNAPHFIKCPKCKKYSWNKVLV